MSKQKFRNHAFYKPNTVQFELAQGCNRHCEFCGSNGFEKKLYFIEPKVLKRQCELVVESGYNSRILIAGHGENTLHPNFYQCIRMMRRLMPKQWIQILTNGYLVRKNLNAIKLMFEAGLNDVTLDEYADSKFSDEELQDVLDSLESEKGMHVELCRMRPGVPLYAPKNVKKHRLLVIPAIDEAEITMSRKLTNHCGAGMPPSGDHVHKTCTRIFRELSFRWDGSVALCCQDFRGQYFVANVMDEDITCFDDIWRHHRFESARRILYHDKRTFFPCNVCDHIPMRAGLIPDHLGKDTMEEPEPYDYEVVNKKWKPLTNIVPREWETEHITDAKHLNIKGRD